MCIYLMEEGREVVAKLADGYADTITQYLVMTAPMPATIFDWKGMNEIRKFRVENCHHSEPVE